MSDKSDETPNCALKGYYGNKLIKTNSYIENRLSSHRIGNCDASLIRALPRMPNLAPKSVFGQTDKTGLCSFDHDDLVQPISKSIFNPKVQMPSETLPGTLPKTIYAERLKKLYSSFSLPNLLQNAGVTADQLVFTDVDRDGYFKLKTMKSGKLTPLWYHDNTEFDVRNSDEWIKLAYSNGIQWPVPCDVYLPGKSDKSGGPGCYAWVNANAIAYDPASRTYSVMLPHETDNVITNVPRIHVYFKGEDPRVLVERIKNAIARRECREKCLIYLKPNYNKLLFTAMIIFKTPIREFKTINWLKDFWVRGVVSKCSFAFSDVKSGWFDISQTSFDVYNGSKLKKLMRLLQFLMQSYLREIVLKSATSYARLIEQPCVKIKGISDDFIWGSDLINSPFDWKGDPIFYLLINMNENEPFYSTDPDRFEPIVVNMFRTGIIQSHNVPLFYPILLPKITFFNKPNLTSIGLLEKEIAKQQKKIETCIRSAIIPLKAYCKEFSVYLPLFNTNVDSYVQKFFDGSPFPSQVKEEVQMHLKMKANIKKVLPSNIAIGPFFINVESLKQILMDKCRQLANSIMKKYAAMTTEKLEICSEEYKGIFLRLGDNPVSIEQVFEIKEWIETIPFLVKTQSDIVQRLVMEIEILDAFWWVLDKEQSDIKWEAIIFPYNLEAKIEETLQNLALETEKFEKIQFEDELTLQNKVEYITGNILKLTLEDSLSRVFEVAVDVAKNWSMIKELQKFGQTLNQRQRLFGHQVTPFDNVRKLVKEFEPYRDLWINAADFLKMQTAWTQNPLSNIVGDSIEPMWSDFLKVITKCTKLFAEIPGALSVANEIKEKIEDFKPKVQLLKDVLNPGMKQRHWDAFAQQTGVEISMSPLLNFDKCWTLGVGEFSEELKQISDNASKEFTIEGALEKMKKEWEHVKLQMQLYKDTGTHIIKISDEELQMLDDHILLTQQLSFSPFKGVFEEELNKWEEDLRLSREVIEAWSECQKQWMYLQPIFISPDIKEQLPVEEKKFSRFERTWKRIIKSAMERAFLMTICPDRRLLDILVDGNIQLNIVQKGLADYLETKRSVFPRFYFLSDDELLEILSHAKNPLAVQPFLKKCFESIFKLDFEADLKIIAMYSGEGERVKLNPAIYPRGTVEYWLLEVENTMRATLKESFRGSLAKVEITPRNKWVFEWPGQVVIGVSQTSWTAHVEHGIMTNTLKNYYEIMLSQLTGLRTLVVSPLKPLERQVLSALIVIEVHARDVLSNLVTLKIKNVNDFDWISQLRYYWLSDIGEVVRAVNAQFPYGFEYLGNSDRLVITPLTDRCYLTLTGALHLKFGGAPAGPAGTGKTETTKDLAKALAIQCVVFNCSDQLDFRAMGKFFKGLASSGAWACFDEFNRIDIEVLSVIAQQVMTIQKALMGRLERFMFEGVEISLRQSCSVFITMNPGYAGRTELPDNLKALFRPVAMMVPDYTLIAEIYLFSYGFNDAKQLGGKITTTFKLSSEQLSSQDHYDFGMRAVKTVIIVAGNLKRVNPDMNEQQIVLRALRDVNVPKFLKDDLKLFNGIASDLFPQMTQQGIDYGSLEKSIRNVILSFGLEDVDDYVRKVIQLYETTVVRHGLMLIGPTGSGKTKCYEILKEALTSLKGTPSPSGALYVTVHTFVLNPKSITMGQLYGEFDMLTHEWTDGILSFLVRLGISAEDSDKRWYVFDGPVDAVWIENMNSVLDDNKKLCLSSGEIMKVTDNQLMAFEVEDLAVASPATVSRCGMVYLEPAVLGLNPFINCWIKKLPKPALHLKDDILKLIDFYVIPAIELNRQKLREIITSVQSALLMSCLNMITIMLRPVSNADGKPVPPAPILALMPNLLPCWVVFAVIWSIGATCDQKSRLVFSSWLRKRMIAGEHPYKFPNEGVVHDYKLHDGGFTMPTDDGEPSAPKWINWMTNVEKFEFTEETTYSEIEIPTIDNVRSSFIIEMLLTTDHNVLNIGPTGTGKTLTIMSKLSRNMPKKYLADFLNFSARTSANQTQDVIDSKLDRRKKGVFGPPILKRLILFIDDFNMPALETYGAQPPIELIRQWMDFGGWYDRRNIGEWKTIIDVNFIAAMGPPGGGRNNITPRLLRHFHYLAFTEMEESSQSNIFGQIIQSWTKRNDNLNTLWKPILQMSLDVYKTISSDLLPTPAKTHYTFNLRDLSKVFQGILMSNPDVIATREELIRLWYHENCRVYQDRLINDEDRNWFVKLLHNKITDKFGNDFVSLVTDQIIFCDFMDQSLGIKSYQRVTNFTELLNVIHSQLEEYNFQTTSILNLVLFVDAVAHICRVSRIIRQQHGNALLLGMGGSGRQSLTKLATFIAKLHIFQIQLTKTYGNIEFRDDIKILMLRAGLYRVESVFLFSDTQIKSESFLEDINNMLSSGDVPNIYQGDELDKIMQNMKGPATEIGLLPTKSNLFSLYLKQVKNNLHCVLTMSPLGEVFRARVRQFPALVNNCTIDWFSDWPESALKSVAHHFLSEVDDLKKSPKLFDGVVDIFQYMQQSVMDESILYLQELNRHIYVTPTSYLELLRCYIDMLQEKKQEITDSMNKLQTGMDKLLTTTEDIKIMQIELIEIKPIIEASRVEVGKMVVNIEADREIAGAKKLEVAQVEEVATRIAEETQELARDAQRDLNKALPMLLAAEESLKSLNKNDISEVKVLKRPPAGVVLVLETICIMKDIKPLKVAGGALGKKVLDYWEPSRNMMADPAAFLNSLLNYDKENMTEALIQKLEPYIENPNFRPEKIITVSKACTSLCSWVHAIYKYYFVNKEVKPKKEALAAANLRLKAAEDELNGAQMQMKEVMDGLELLQKNLNDAMDKKNKLEAKSKLCEDRMDRALRLIDGLANERERWIQLIANYKVFLVNIIGDILICAGSIAYLTPFTDKYRKSLQDRWMDMMEDRQIPRSANSNIISILGEPVTIRHWQMAGLPRDDFSVENAILMFNSKRWPLIIDPQGQANKWIKNLGKTLMNGISVCKLSDKSLLQELQTAVRSGKTCLIENIGTELDPAMDSLFSRSVFIQGGVQVIKIGESIVPYHKDFQLFITTKLPNPHYLPEVSVKVIIVNFTLVASGLLDQLLAIVVMQERPDLEEMRSAIVVGVAQMKSELKETQDRILKRLTAAEGSPVDDLGLIMMLESSKLKSDEIMQKVRAAEKTQIDIDETRALYIPVANRGQLLYFCLAELPVVDPMYQYSLNWFIGLFISSIQETDKSENIEERVSTINNHFTFNLYCNVCRSLFERNKMQFAVLLCVRIMIEAGTINFNEWTFFLAGGAPLTEEPNPAPSWLPDRAWKEIQSLANLPVFVKFVENFAVQSPLYKKIIDSPEPHRETLPPPWDKQFDYFQFVMILKCLRPDKVLNGLQDFLIRNIGARFVEPQSSDLGEMYKDSTPTVPLIFILSVGTDPASGLYKLADKMKMTKRFFSISLGQGQGPLAESLYDEAITAGNWIFFQNCHLSPSWMPRLEYLVESISPDHVHKDFRIWLTSSPSPSFPVSILQNGSKMTIEPPRGVKANLLRAFTGPIAEYATYMSSEEEKTKNFKWLLFSLCLFHGVCLERRKFGSLGFNIAYEFTDGDLRICINQLFMFLNEYDTVPYEVLKYTAGQINYGGRVTDDWDRRCVMNVLQDFYDPAVLSTTHAFDAETYYYQQSPEADYDDYLAYIKTLPVNDDPALFGLHSNADITFAQSETYRTLGILLSLQPRTTLASSSDGEDVLNNMAQSLLRDIPDPWPSLGLILEKYPVMYEESLNTVLMQELVRFNRLLSIVQDTLKSLLKALKGLVVMTDSLEQMMKSVMTNQIPLMWAKRGYPSLKPLGAWVVDLRARVEFLNKWIDNGIPSSFWISGFFFPQAFLTGCLQNYARKNVLSIDAIQYSFTVLDSAPDKRPENGCVIYGLFLEGCRWNEQLRTLDESRPKELYTEMPPIWLIPEQGHKLKSGFYVCPIYKTLTRAGTLSTTGHSTNFVLSIEVPSNQPQSHWVKRGVALICALNY
ncbi:dynein axonemal heavy chain 1-like [Adelges cooleyi]|uniref:dynein axonemal heavy chain 1-like n=1 Tax=Adelges cooleyi TaxID=133065 RepID=UPI00217F85ED|nr:dynein axonemal heavy chain 1-like [Adelges cooleyi]